jgi:predicted DNA-binding transcriptional regulator YafY
LSDAWLRQWLLLRNIPRHPRRVDARRLMEVLSAEGVSVSLRTIQRDVLALSRVFPLECDEAKPQGWSWSRSAGQFDVPGMDPSTALAFCLARAHLDRVLPSGVVEQLKPWFESAGRVLGTAPSALGDWARKIRVVAPMPDRVVPEIDVAVRDSVHEALLLGQQIEVAYGAITRDLQTKTYLVHPLGLVVRDQAIYLVCTVKTYPDARFLALHRIREARILPQRARVPKDFDLDAMIQRELGIRIGDGMIPLVLRVRGVVRRQLEEAPLGADQDMERLDDVWARVSATVRDTVLLRNWLRALGADVVVESPGQLADEIRGTAEEVGRLYGTHVGGDRG